MGTPRGYIHQSVGEHRDQAVVDQGGSRRVVSPYSQLRIQAALRTRYQIEVPVWDWMGKRHVRPSCQAYNHSRHYELLAQAVIEISRQG